MPNIFIIIGDPNAGKSRTIRALTGANRVTGTGYRIGTTTGEINVYVKLSALQENNIPPRDFIRTIQQGNYQNVLVCLRRKQSNGQPDAIFYIEEFLNVGWNIKQIVVLGQALQNLQRNVPQPNYIPNPNQLPSNTIASYVRQWWQWL